MVPPFMDVRSYEKVDETVKEADEKQIVGLIRGFLTQYDLGPTNKISSALLDRPEKLGNILSDITDYAQEHDKEEDRPKIYGILRGLEQLEKSIVIEGKELVYAKALSELNPRYGGLEPEAGSDLEDELEQILESVEGNEKDLVVKEEIVGEEPTYAAPEPASTEEEKIEDYIAPTETMSFFSASSELKGELSKVLIVGPEDVQKVRIHLSKEDVAEALNYAFMNNMIDYDVVQKLVIKYAQEYDNLQEEHKTDFMPKETPLPDNFEGMDVKLEALGIEKGEKPNTGGYFIINRDDQKKLELIEDIREEQRKLDLIDSEYNDVVNSESPDKIHEHDEFAYELGKFVSITNQDEIDEIFAEGEESSNGYRECTNEEEGKTYFVKTIIPTMTPTDRIKIFEHAYNEFVDEVDALGIQLPEQFARKENREYMVERDIFEALIKVSEDYGTDYFEEIRSLIIKTNEVYEAQKIGQYVENYELWELAPEDPLVREEFATLTAKEIKEIYENEMSIEGLQQFNLEDDGTLTPVDDLDPVPIQPVQVQYRLSHLDSNQDYAEVTLKIDEAITSKDKEMFKVQVKLATEYILSEDSFERLRGLILTETGNESFHRAERSIKYSLSIIDNAIYDTEDTKVWTKRGEKKKQNIISQLRGDLEKVELIKEMIEPGLTMAWPAPQPVQPAQVTQPAQQVQPVQTPQFVQLVQTAQVAQPAQVVQAVQDPQLVQPAQTPQVTQTPQSVQPVQTAQPAKKAKEIVKKRKLKVKDKPQDSQGGN